MLHLTKPKIKVLPSILSADFAHIADEVKKLEAEGVDGIHIDIMDGHFVPNLTMGPAMVSAIKRNCSLFLDVHLMIYNPFDYIEAFVKAGADRITFHFEATEDVEDTIDFIRKCNVEVGLAFNPETSMSMIPKYLDKVDLVLLMTVNPGFSGQEFIEDVLDKISFVRQICTSMNILKGGKVLDDKTPKEKNIPMQIQVDGGINEETAKKCLEAGADVLVSGSYLFSQNDRKHAIQKLKGNNQ